jgi:hypothetical protein
MEASIRFKAIFLILGFVPLVAIGSGALLFGVSIPALTRDLSAVAGVNPLLGLLSTLGILIWSATAAVWLCTYIIAQGADLSQQRLAASSVVLTAWLAFDDGFQFHEFLAPHYLHIAENWVLFGLLCAISAYLFTFRNQLRRTPYRLNWALGLLSASVIVDLLSESAEPLLGQWEYFVEDGLKWAGIVGWLAFALGEFRRTLASSIDPVKLRWVVPESCSHAPDVD